MDQPAVVKLTAFHNGGVMETESDRGSSISSQGPDQDKELTSQDVGERLLL